MGMGHFLLILTVVTQSFLQRMQDDKPRQLPPRPNIDSPVLLARIRMTIKDIVTPTWVTSIPLEFGSKKAGHLKADQWRTLWTIVIPMAMLSLWLVGLPSTSPDAEEMSAVLDNAMSLVSLVTLACKHTTSKDRARKYREHLRNYIEGLKTLFPGFLLPYHHALFHLADFFELFGPIRGWWCFPFERLIGDLQDIPHNHKYGTLS